MQVFRQYFFGAALQLYLRNRPFWGSFRVYDLDFAP
jgi:hypothetical protein